MVVHYGGHPVVVVKDANDKALRRTPRMYIIEICTWSLSSLSSEQQYSTQDLQKYLSNMNTVAIDLGIPRRTYVNYDILTIYPGVKVVI